MARSNLIAALVVALVILALEAEAGENLRELVSGQKKDINKMISPKNGADAEEAFSFEKEYIHERDEEKSDKQKTDEFLKAVYRVLHKPDQCDELSLRYIGTISRHWPQRSEETKDLTEVSQLYGHKCLTPERIVDNIKSRASDYSSKVALLPFNIEEFIDDEFIAYYWSVNSERDHGIDFRLYGGSWSRQPIAEAMIRRGKKLAQMTHVHTYLEQHLYKPCSEYYAAFRSVIDDIFGASLLLGQSYDDIISSLDDNSKKIDFRFHLCKNIKLFIRQDIIESGVLQYLEKLGA